MPGKKHAKHNRSFQPEVTAAGLTLRMLDFRSWPELAPRPREPVSTLRKEVTAKHDSNYSGIRSWGGGSEMTRAVRWDCDSPGSSATTACRSDKSEMTRAVRWDCDRLARDRLRIKRDRLEMVRAVRWVVRWSSRSPSSDVLDCVDCVGNEPEQSGGIATRKTGTKLGAPSLSPGNDESSQVGWPDVLIRELLPERL